MSKKSKNGQKWGKNENRKLRGGNKGTYFYAGTKPIVKSKGLSTKTAYLVLEFIFSLGIDLSLDLSRYLLEIVVRTSLGVSPPKNGRLHFGC